MIILRWWNCIKPCSNIDETTIICYLIEYAHYPKHLSNGPIKSKSNGHNNKRRWLNIFQSKSQYLCGSKRSCNHHQNHKNHYQYRQWRIWNKRDVILKKVPKEGVQPRVKKACWLYVFIFAFLLCVAFVFIFLFVVSVCACYRTCTGARGS